MPRAEKLRSSSDFRRTYAEGSRSPSKAVIVHVRRSGSGNPSRLGVTTVKGFRGAVRRNRARRRLREAAGAVEGPLRPGVDVVLVATPATLSASFQNLVNTVREALSRADVIDA